MLSPNTERRLLRCLRGKGAYHSIELNRILWSLDSDMLVEACNFAEAHGHPIREDVIAFQKELREKWPDPKATLESLREACRQFPMASRPLRRRSWQAALYVLLDFARWANADPEFVLKVIEHIWQKTREAGDAGYSQLLYKNDEFKWWPREPEHNRCCFVMVCLAKYSQFAPATCRRVFLAGISSSAGGHYHYERRGRECLDTNTGEFTFWGLTYDAMEAASRRLSDLSHRIYSGGWK